MTTNIRTVRRWPLRRHILAAAVLSTLPLVGACVSALDDTTAFGFAGAVPSEDILGAEQQAGSDLVVADGEVTASATIDDEVSASATVDASTVSQEAPVAGVAEAPPPASPSILDAGDKAIAAYAGGSVSEGDRTTSAQGGREADRSLFASLFARSAARTPIANAEKGKSRRVVLQRDGAPSSGGGDALPGVDPSSLFEIGQRASADDEEILEEASGSYQVASLTGFARVAPNGLRVQRESVQTNCFPAKLVGTLRAIERRFGKKIVVTSGYRSPRHNRRVNGARRSQHMGCKAADIVVPDVDRFAVAAYVRSLPGRGGVGTYCHTAAIHVDVGPKRDWNWRCRSK
ncbi:YcbK family protein [Aurantimonas marianensis]|uniref:YcbK family protein n=1 Tax=Aurantimonas marianensis TaxID=2920428 RepID=UPI0020A6F737|nr:D-Ala-D-Ala carboxypeptidase family metallohydrolase [Aurantimonas marianensis]